MDDTKERALFVFFLNTFLLAARIDGDRQEHSLRIHVLVHLVYGGRPVDRGLHLPIALQVPAKEINAGVQSAKKHHHGVELHRVRAFVIESVGEPVPVHLLFIEQDRSRSAVRHDRPPSALIQVETRAGGPVCHRQPAGRLSRAVVQIKGLQDREDPFDLFSKSLADIRRELLLKSAQRLHFPEAFQRHVQDEIGGAAKVAVAWLPKVLGAAAHGGRVVVVRVTRAARPTRLVLVASLAELSAGYFLMRAEIRPSSAGLVGLPALLGLAAAAGVGRVQEGLKSSMRLGHGRFAQPLAPTRRAGARETSPRPHSPPGIAPHFLKSHTKARRERKTRFMSGGVSRA
eukprot:scaffold521_cov226-Pinguiococcus_pyrenoidosus.AAC.4